MLIKSILSTISIAWSWLWYFVKSGCEEIINHAEAILKRINSKKNRNTPKVKKAKRIGIYALFGLLVVLFPIAVYGIVGGLIYSVVWMIFNLIYRLLAMFMPNELFISVRAAAWIAISFLPFIFVLKIIFRFFRGGPRGLECDEVCSDVLKLLFSAISMSKDALRKYCIIPNIVQQIYNKETMRGQYNNEHKLTVHLKVREKIDVVSETAGYLQSVVQSNIDAEIEAGSLDGVSWVTSETWIKVVRVVQEGYLLCIDVILVRPNSAKLAVWKADNNYTSKPEADDEDDFF
jgi:nitrate reductase NapE component